MPTDEVKTYSTGAQETLKQHSKIDNAAMSDTEAWFWRGALNRTIPGTISDAMLVTNQDGVIVSVNHQFELLFGYHQLEVIGRAPKMLLFEPARARHVKQRLNAGDDLQVHDAKHELKAKARRKNGGEIDVLVNLGPIVMPTGVYTIVIIRKVWD